MTINERRRIGAANADAQVRLIRKLREIRVARGVQVADVADAMGVDATMVYRFEKGGTNYTAATLRKYAKAVGALLYFDATDASLAADPMGTQKVSVADTIHDRRAASIVKVTFSPAEQNDRIMPVSGDVAWAGKTVVEHVNRAVTQLSARSESAAH